MLMSSEIQKSESGLRWVEVHRNPPQSTLYFMFSLPGLCTTLNSFFFASRVINFKYFLIFFNIFDGKIKLLCFLKGKGGNKIIFITLYITIIYKLLFKQIRIFRVY